MQSSITLYSLGNYSFGSKDSIPDLDQSRIIDSLYQHVSSKGMKTSVQGVLLVHEHNHPHLLMIQNSKGLFSLAGGALIPGEDEITGLGRILNLQIGSQSSPTWDIGDVTSVLYRPNFESFWYPYLPCHITKPKEIKKTFIVHLPEKKTFTVAKNIKVVAVPLYEIHDNASRYGNDIAALSWILSGFNFVYEN